jgi:uncharacterized membrane protein YebE (DUF533 family)
MTITATEGETALATFASAFLGVLVSASFVLTSAVVETAAITGLIAALGVLGYHVYSGNVSTATAPPAAPPAA